MDCLTDKPRDYRGGVRCDACKATIKTPGEEFLHCNHGCKEDYCSKCKHKAKKEVPEAKPAQRKMMAKPQTDAKPAEMKKLEPKPKPKPKEAKPEAKPAQRKMIAKPQAA